ncbi:chromate transporter [Peribacillus asahii]|uniref:Transporter n=1 Tax=Peribacillus asahii TaxID=228899 RepID=A0A3Q9RKR3_9BACI|nr:chromate transporter [Peribacillus asahii]AZV41466.1 transporter [Peribacillus asahii]USK70954.1 chromate transporter [Peribacillus asahii]USK85867.1 chromate transporter [Peribacillus asahii]
MIWFPIFLAFFIANILGYGGGPASIPLMYDQIVTRYGWLNNTEFSNMLALGNALPGPIATKIAAFVGYEVYGWPGFIMALIGTVVPSAVALILLLKIIRRYRHSLVFKGVSLLAQPVIAIMMLLITITIATDAVHSIGYVHSLIIALFAFLALGKFKIHPAFVIILAFMYGGIIIPWTS